MALQAVFFDLDDTLCDTINSREHRARKALEAFCGHHREYELEQLLERVLQPHPAIERDIRGLASVFADLGVEKSAGAEAAYASYAEYFDPIRLFGGVTETLGRLSLQYKLGIITNGREAVQRGKIAHFGFDSYVRWVVVSEAVGLSKPDPRIFHHALALAEVPPHEAASVGDRLDMDVSGAKVVGMSAVWFNHWGGKLHEGAATPDATIERFSELPDVLANL